ncbi:MAG TPA: hypothetical protein VFQ53_25835 [Kofleriaceae bacterium]|nr:hypothetical protein [Kofleriaceae bacterium]
MRRACLNVGLIVGLLVVVGGCITPSIPIPPPDPGKMTFAVDETAGSAVFTYPADQNYVDTVVFIYNRDRGVGIIENAQADGSVGPTAPVSAGLGDQIVVSFQRDDQTVSTCVRLRQGSQSATDYCGP